MRPSIGLVLSLMLSSGCGGEESGAPAAPRVQLPAPAPAQHRPLTSPPATELEWRWLHPLPRAMPRWNGVDVHSGQVAAVGAGGFAAVLSDQGMRRWVTGIDRTLHAVSLMAPNVALAVGEGGVLVAMLPDGSRVVNLQTEATLRAIQSYGPTDALVVGDEGTVIRLEHMAPRALPLPREAADAALFGVHLEDEEGRRGFVVGRGGLILRLHEDALEVERPARGPNLRAITRCEASGVVAVGDAGLVLRLDEGRWSRVPTEGSEGLSDVGCAGPFALASGTRGGTFLIDGARSVRVAGHDELAFRSVATRPAGERIWLAGDAGRLAYFERDHIVSLTAGTSTVLTDAADLAGELVVVGYWGTVLRRRNDRFESLSSPTDAGLSAVAAISAGELVAVGEAGTVLSISHRGVQAFPGSESLAGVSLHAVVGGEARFLAVGDAGTIVRGVLGAVTRDALYDPTASGAEQGATLYGLAGTTDDAVAVGERGTIVRLGEGGSQPIASCTDATLRAVLLEGEGEQRVVYAAGEGGVVVRVAAGVCRVERAAGADEGPAGALHALGHDPEGHVLAVGDHGRVLVRGDDGAWTRVDLDVSGHALRGLTRDRRNVYVVGSGGVVLRHVRTDAPEGGEHVRGAGGVTG